MAAAALPHLLHTSTTPLLLLLPLLQRLLPAAHCRAQRLPTTADVTVLLLLLMMMALCMCVTYLVLGVHISTSV